LATEPHWIAVAEGNIIVCLFTWDLTALSAQIGYIAPQK